MVKRYPDMLTVPNGYNVPRAVHAVWFLFDEEVHDLGTRHHLVAHENFSSLLLPYAIVLFHLVLDCYNQFSHIFAPC